MDMRPRLPIDFNYFRNDLVASFLQAENKLLEVMEEWKNKLPLPCSISTPTSLERFLNQGWIDMNELAIPQKAQWEVSWTCGVSSSFLLDQWA